MTQASKHWQTVDGKLRREVKFKDFIEAIAFVNKLVPIAEAAQHHPDLAIMYNRVAITLWTHDAGGITEKDHVLAGQIDLLLG